MTLLSSSVRALLMLDELHRIGFEQLRFVSLGDGLVHIFAAADEMPHTTTDKRFIPAVRRFTAPRFMISTPDEFLDQRWAQHLGGHLQPNHLAGLFVLDFPDIARHAFGPDLAYREWFKRLRPYLQQGLLPCTHGHLNFKFPVDEIYWHNGQGPERREAIPVPPANQFVPRHPEQEEWLL